MNKYLNPIIIYCLIIFIYSCDCSKIIESRSERWLTNIPFILPDQEIELYHDNRVYESKHFLIFSDACNDKIKIQTSEDGVNWTNYQQNWISYDDIQMDIDDNHSIPILFELKQNYPNPFNPLTTITFELPQESNISIKIYNSLGNEIKTIVNEFKPTGQYQLNWDGTDNSGETVSGGTYFCQLKAGDFIQTRKMVLLK